MLYYYNYGSVMAFLSLVFHFGSRWVRLYIAFCIGLIVMIGPISVLHKFEIDSNHHHVQECSICHLVHAGTPNPEIHNALLPLGAEHHRPPTVILKGFQSLSSPLARAPPRNYLKINEPL